MREADLYPIVERWMRRHFRCFKTVIDKGLRYGRIDVLGVRDVGGDLSGEVETVAIEVKKGVTPFAKASGQTLGYRVYANRVYLADLRRESFTPDEIHIASNLGIGLIEIRGRTCKEVLSSPHYQPITKLNLSLLESVAIGRCQICESFFETGNSEFNRHSTLGGRGTVPDAIVIDVEGGEWYVVEAERAVHGTWEHIAPQVSRQLAAVGTPSTHEVIIRYALDQLRESAELREMFREIGIGELEVHGHLQRILSKPPTIAIPIDGIPKDLTDWVRTLRNNVKIWLVEKYVSTSEPTRVLYSLPDENLPTLSTTSGGGGALNRIRRTGSQPYQGLITAMPQLIGQEVYMDYAPRGGARQRFNGTLRSDGIEVDGTVYSPSYAAVHCMRKTGSTRTTENGWIKWMMASGETLNDLYQRLQSAGSSEEDGEPQHDL